MAAASAAAIPDKSVDQILFVHHLQQQKGLPQQERAAELSKLQQHLDDSLGRPGSNFAGRMTVVERDAAVLAQQFAAEQNQLGAFSFPVFFRQLRTKEFGQQLMHAPRVTSTQTLLYEHGSAFPDGLVFVADQQVQGRGRRQNGWESPAGCLMFTAKFPVAQFQQLPFVQYVGCLAMARAIRVATEGLVQPDIKWPNDIMFRGVKLGGILCQSSIMGNRIEVYMGIGVNVANSFPTSCLNDMLRDMLFEQLAAQSEAIAAPAVGNIKVNTTAEEEEENPELSPRLSPRSVPQLSTAALLAAFCNEFEPILAQFQERGFHQTPLMVEYLDTWLHSKQRLSVRRPDSQQEIPVEIQGLSRDGYLLARSLHNPEELHELHPDGNSLDMLQGLVLARDV